MTRRRKKKRREKMAWAAAVMPTAAMVVLQFLRNRARRRLLAVSGSRGRSCLHTSPTYRPTNPQHRTHHSNSLNEIHTLHSAANLRRLLLGGGSDNDFSEDSDDGTTSKAKPKNSKSKNISDDEEEEEEEERDVGFDDDFFTNDGEGDEKIDTVPSKSKKGKAKGEETDMVFTYVPDAAKQLQDKKKDDQQMDETPFETMQRKLAEKKKARKAAKKLIKSGGVNFPAGKTDVEAGKSSGKGTAQEAERAAATKAELELLLSDDDEGYDMRALHKQEQEAIKGPKGKRKAYVLVAVCIVSLSSNLFSH
jgi:hypothetical protein